MRDPLRDIEEFVKEKLSFLNHSYPDDWSAFERKLQRAVFFKRLKIFTSLGVVSLTLFWANQNFILSSPEPAQNNPYRQEQTVANQGSSHREYSFANNRDDPQYKKSIHFSPKAVNKKFLASPLSGRKAKLKGTEVLEMEWPRKQYQAITNLEQRPVKPVAEHNDKLRVYNPFDEYPDPWVPKELNLADYFLEIRSPDYEVLAPKTTGPYISPLQEVNPWSYSINVYPNFTFRKFRVDPDKTGLMHSDFIDEMENNSKSGFSLNIGFEVSKRVGAVTYLHSGVEYITNTYEADFNFPNFRDAVVDPHSGEITRYSMKDKTEQIVFSDNNQFHYINFPLSISYQPWANEHLRLNIEVGGSYLHFLTANGTTIDHKTLEVIDLSSQNYRKSMASFSAKFGAQYYVTRKINIGFEPTIMYFTNTIYTKEYPFYVIPYSVGLNFNIQVKLN